MIYKLKQKAFTVIELIVVMAIIFLISTLSFFWLRDFIKRETINNEVRTLVSFLEEAKSKTLSAKNASQYGVRTETNQIIFFEGSSYVSGDPDNKVHDIDSGIYISIGGGVDTVFQKLTGEVSGVTGSRSIILYTTDLSVERSVIIHSSGLIESVEI